MNHVSPPSPTRHIDEVHLFSSLWKERAPKSNPHINFEACHERVKARILIMKFKRKRNINIIKEARFAVYLGKLTFGGSQKSKHSVPSPSLYKIEKETYVQQRDRQLPFHYPKSPL